MAALAGLALLVSGAVTATVGQQPAFPRKRLVHAFTRSPRLFLAFLPQFLTHGAAWPFAGQIAPPARR